MSLTPKQALFVDEYLIDLNGTQAAIRAGYSPKTAEKIASENIRKPEVAAELARRMAARVERIHATQDDVVENLAAWLKSDVREIVEYRRSCCRFCHGLEFQYQETPAERRARKASHDAMLLKVAPKDWAKLPQFDDLGGVGFDGRKEPNPQCPECWGEGDGQVRIADTRTLSKGAAMLYAGVKITANGLEVKMHSKDKAAELLGRHLGLWDKAEGDPNAPRTIVHKSDPDV